MRQFLCSVVAIGFGITVYFGTKDVLHKEVVSWLCILSALPIAAAGFITYHGLTLEKFIVAWFKSEFLYPKQIVLMVENIYDKSMLDYYDRTARQQLKNEKQERKTARKRKRGSNDKITKED